ncbi:MAG TPA: RagB/SusD family nutrient uptake outer membrane protein [Flavitalea sp.]|nr:RagB/SusD family nutrient uptake outer membrane protein [Flavitalea sp.]
MKKLYFILVIAVFTGCSKDFINLVPISDQSIEGFYKSETDISQAVIGVYDGLQGLYSGNFAYFMEVPSDNSFNSNTTGNGGANADFDNFTLASSNFILNDTWNACYKDIQRCNIILNRINGVTMNEQLKSYRTGEVKFIRAILYFNMVRIWGDVPLIVEEIDDPFEAFDHVRDPTDKVYAQIIKDLEEAIAVLPGKWPAANDLGRVTQGAAITLLGKVYLTRKDYAGADLQLEKVISSGTYKLVSDFAKVFGVENENNIESIFEVQYKSDAFGEGGGDGGLYASGDGNNWPSANMINLFRNNNDARYDASIDTTFNFPKFAKLKAVRGADGSFGSNFMVLRYADVLLMAAESLNEISYDKGNAFNYLNQVRQRAGAPVYNQSSLPDQQSFRAAIELERRLELAFENHRWFDLLRTGRALQVMSTAVGGSAFPINIKPYQLLFPIPLEQVDASGGKIKQNPEY